MNKGIKYHFREHQYVFLQVRYISPDVFPACHSEASKNQRIGRCFTIAQCEHSLRFIIEVQAYLSCFKIERSY